MRLNLTKLQRVVIGVTSVGILLTVYQQMSYSGFDGYWWIVPVLIAVGLVVIAINPSPARGAIVPLDAIGNRLLWHDAARQVQVMSDAATAIGAILLQPKMRELVGNPLTDADSVHLQTLAEEGVRIKAFTYGYMIVDLLCKKQDRRYLESEHKRALRMAYARVCEISWKKIYGTTADEGRAYELAVAALRKSVEQTDEIELAIENRVLAGDAHPLAPLYEYLDGSLVKKPLIEDLEMRFSPITKALLVRYNQ